MDLPPFRKFILPSLKTPVTCPQALPLLTLGFSPCPSTLLPMLPFCLLLQNLTPCIWLHSSYPIITSTLHPSPLPLSSFSFNCASQHSSYLSRFLSPVSWVHLCLLSIPGLLLPCIPFPSLPESKAILNTELFFLCAQPLIDRICSPFTAGKSQLTSLPLLTRQVSDMGQTGERQQETRHTGPGAQRGGILVGSGVGLERDNK